MSWLVVAPVIVLALGVELFVATQREPAARRAALLAGVGVVAFPVGIVLHNVLSAVIGGEEGASFVVALLVAPALVAIGTIGVALAVRRTHPANDLWVGLGVAGAGLALFSAYTLFAFVVTTIAGGNPSYQGAIEQLALPASGILLVSGVLYSAFALFTTRAGETLF